ncbi:amidohydrolase 3 [Streptomyces malaysiensis subsp. malaysiensis]|nr:amidohydrolase 3 [Streptomyces malaysiensis]
MRGDRIAALSPDPNGLDDWVTSRTTVHDLPDATVLPAFDDTHTHLIFAAYGARRAAPSAAAPTAGSTAG